MEEKRQQGAGKIVLSILLDHSGRKGNLPVHPFVLSLSPAESTPIQWAGMTEGKCGWVGRGREGVCLEPEGERREDFHQL